MADSAAPIGLRTRRSQADSRVTLFSLEGQAAAEDSSESKPDVSSSSPATRRARNVRAKAEDDSAGESPVTPRKRPRKTKVKEEGESDEEESEKKLRRPSMSPRKPTPTKLRAKLEVAHPEPPRWRETYEIVSGFAGIRESRLSLDM